MAWTRIGTTLVVLSTLVAACDDGDDSGDSTMVVDGGNRDGGGQVPDARNEGPPVASDGSGTTAEDAPLTGQLEASDPDGNTLTFSATTQPMHGTLEVDADGSFTYTPAAEYAGPDEFGFSVTDGAFSDTGTFTITVEAVNDPPRIVDQADLSTIEDTPITIALGDVTVEDPDSDPTGFTLTVMDGAGYSHLGNVVTPVADFSGLLHVMVVVADGDGATSGITQLAVDVVAVNDPPRILGQNTVTTSEDQPRTLGLADLIVVDPDDAVPAGLTLAVGAGANYTVSGTTVTPTGQFTGTLTVPVTVSDGDATSAPFNLSVLVTPANDAPVIVGQKTVTIAEDTPRTITLGDLTVTDPDDAYPGGFTLTVLPGTSYTVSGAQITPAANFNGTLSVGVRVNDGETDSNTFALQVTVTPVNDAPTITGQTAISTPEETPRQIAFNELTVVDPDNTYPNGFTMTVLGGTNYTVSGRVVTPAANFVGTLTVPVRVTDGALASNTFNLTVTVSAQNDAPVITGQDPISIVEDGSRLLTLADLNVTDPDDTFPTGFTLEVDPGPNYTLAGATVIPADDFAGTLTVPVRVNDGAADSNTFPLVITVTPVNDAPVITGQRNVEAVEDTPRTIVFADLTVVDVDDTYPTGFTLTVLPGSNYTVSGTTITPAPDYTGPLSVPVRVNDGAANSNTFNLAVTVTATNDPPVIVSQDPVTTAEDTPRAIGFADLNVTDGDDSYPTGFSLVVLPGTSYTVSGTTITPAANFNGSLTVPVRVNDGVADSNTFNLLVTVTPVNDPPVITSDNGVTMVEDTSRAIGFADLDIVDPDDAVPAGLTLAVLPGTNYTVTGTTITPAADFVGTLTVNVRVNDGAANSNTYPLPVTVTPANDAPVITAQAPITITEDSSRTILFADLTVVDVDDDYPSGFTLTVLPGTGYTVAGTTITPALNRTAALSVNVRVNDGSADSNVFPLVVNITPVNDAPVIVSQNPVSTPEETARTIVFADLDVTDVDDSYPTGFTLSVGAGSNYTVSGTTITPAAGFSGTLTVPVQVSDGELSSNTFNLSVTVTAVNDPPLITGQGTVTVAEDGTRAIAFGDLTVTDPDDTYPSGFTLTVIDGANYSVSGTTISPDDDYFGPLSVPVRVNDGQADSNTFNLAVTVTAVNDAPAITGQDPLSIAEEGSRAIVIGDLTVVDPDDTGFTVEVDDGPNYSVAGTTVTADTNFVGTLSVPVRVNDGDVDSPTFNLSITVTPVNDAPQITAADPLTIAEEGSHTFVIGDLTVVDPDDTVFTVEVDDGPNYSVAGTTITADTNFVGTLNVPVRVNDGDVDSPTFTVVVNVTAVNDPPSITGQDPITIDEDTSRTIVIGDLTVVDPDDTVFTVEVDDGPNYSVAGTTVTPDPDYSGPLGVTVRVNDGDVDSAGFTLAITVTPVNDAPTITGQVPLETTQGSSIAVTVGDLTIVDPDDTVFTLAIDGGDGYVVEGDSVIPDGEFVGTLNVPVRVNDGDVDSETFVLAITVAPLNNPLTATADTARSAGNTRLTVAAPGVLGNDRGAVAARAAHATTARGGTIDLDAGGGYTYLPPVGFTGTDTFVYTIVDADGARASGTITFSVGRPVWYVRAGARGAGDGRSTAPFATLAQAEAASAAGDTIFVFAGTYAGGIALKADQRLAGEASGLTLPAGNPSIPAGARPVVSVAEGSAIRLASGVTVSGLEVAAPAGAAFEAVGTTGGTLADVVLGRSLVGYRLEDASGLTIVDGRSTALADALLVVPDGHFVADLTVSGGRYAGVGDAAGDVALDLGSGFATGTAQLRGTVLLEDTEVAATGQDGLFVENAGLPAGTLRLVDSSITAMSRAGHGLLVRAAGAAELHLELEDSRVAVGPRGHAIDAVASDEALLGVALAGGALAADDGLRVSADGAGARVTVDVEAVDLARVHLTTRVAGARLDGRVQACRGAVVGEAPAGRLELFVDGKRVPAR